MTHTPAFAVPQRWMLALLAMLLVLVAACWNVDFKKVAALAGNGGQGGQGGEAGNGQGGSAASGGCPFFQGSAPTDCDQALLSDPADCCVKGRSCQGAACQAGSCQSKTHADNGDETVDVLVVGDLVVWSSGWGGQIMAVPVAGGAVQAVADDPNDWATAIATDGQRVYWVEYANSHVYSVDPEIGGSSRVLIADTTISYKAVWGRITVHEDRVFWVTEDQPGVWMAAADGSQANSPTLVYSAGNAYGVAADGAHLYWTDTTQQAVVRLAYSDLGKIMTPEIVVGDQGNVGDIAINQGQLYWVDGGTVLTRPLTGGAVNSIGTSPNARGLAFDDVYVYWSSGDDSSIYKARRDLSGGTELVTAGNVPIKHVASSCNSLFFTNNGDGSAG